MKVGFTASRNGITQNQVDQLIRELKALKATEFHQGCCVGGDHTATVYVFAYFPDIKIVAHPPDDVRLMHNDLLTLSSEVRDNKPYLVRNHDIVDETDMLIAGPDTPERLRSGTWATVRYARKKGKRVIILERDK